MNARLAYLLLAVGAVGMSASASAQSADPSVVKVPADIEYKGLTGAPQRAVLFGDPTKSEMYVERLKLPAGMKSQPHWHPDYPRTVAVLSGTFYFGKGEQWDESKLVAYPAGTFYSEPAKSPHFWWAKDGEVILQITAIGPTATTRVEQKN
jgi:quercetin dioxygenase-like cupin family protein